MLVDVADSLRLFGGRRALLHRLRATLPSVGGTGLAAAPTALAALALLRTLPPFDLPPFNLPQAAEVQHTPPVRANLGPRHANRPAPDTRGPGPRRVVTATPPLPALACPRHQLQATLDALPLAHLSAARDHLPLLARLGCQTWGQLRALPRDGLARRFGAALLEALDRAYGLRPEAWTWTVLPETFSARLEFTGRVEVAQGLLFGAQRLLAQLDAWLQARQRGVLALTLHWEHDLVRRGELRHGELPLRTATATRDMRHLARLLGEHLARTPLAAPVLALRLDATETEPYQADNGSLLPEDLKEGESMAQLIERLSARLGADRVMRGRLLADHRPQHMQVWFPASLPVAPARPPTLPHHLCLQPPWLLPKPLRLDMRGESPWYQGPLRMLAGPERLETGWWSFADAADTEGEELALRDYYVARSPQAGLLWVYRRRSAGEPAWFLQGIYG